MRRLKKNIFLGFSGGMVLLLTAVRLAFPSVTGPRSVEGAAPSDSLQADTASVIRPLQADLRSAAGRRSMPFADLSTRHPIYSVPSYKDCFPDLQDTQMAAAIQWGVSSVKNRAEAEERKSELVYVGANPYFCIDAGMNSSIPYLVPRASLLLQRIGQNFLDSLYVKGIPMHQIIVSSVLRTEEDVARLRLRNANASEQSCHSLGTTFDVCYNRYVLIEDPQKENQRATSNDTLKWVLSEVLRDMRAAELCYVKYEVKQGCFHITVR